MIIRDDISGYVVFQVEAVMILPTENGEDRNDVSYLCWGNMRETATSGK